MPCLVVWCLCYGLYNQKKSNMKKVILLISSWLFLWTNLIQAQTDTTELQTDSLDEFIQTWKSSFKGLNKTLLPTGMLKQYSIFPITVSDYNGQYDSIIDMNLIHELHSQCKSMVLDSSKSLLPFDSIENRSAYYRSLGINPLVILDYRYNSFHDSAFTWHLIDSSNNYYTNVVGQSQSPYITENVFGISPFCFSMGREKTVSFYLGTDMYLGNKPDMINHLSINYGAGWLTLTPGITVHQFPDFGIFDVSIRFTLEDGSLFTCKFKVSITKSITDLGLDFHYNDIQADIAFDGRKPKGVYVYRFGKGNASGCFKKPFIMTDGVDFGYAMDKAYGWEHCRDGKCNTLGFIDIYTGKDYNYATNTNNEPRPEFAKGSKLIDKLYAEGYDVIFLDFEAGAGYMQGNAMLLIKLIDSINHNKCSKEELVVCGPSMGGQILRYALSYMETKNMKHCVRTAVYFDSPHKGANIPIGMQLWLNYFTNHNTENIFADAEIAVKQKLDRLATRQLLNNHYSVSNYNQTTDRDYFMNDLVNNLGSFPKYIRQVAIPNGSCNLQKQIFNNGASLIDLKIPFKHGHHTIRGVSYATCGNPTSENRIFYGDAMGGYNLEKTNWDQNRQPFDNAPGSGNDALKAMEKIQQIGKRRLNYEAVKAPYVKSTFIPTNSGLCLESNDLLYNVKNEISNQDIPNRSKYAFDAYCQHDDNQIHVEMTDGNIDWIISELKRTENILFNLPATYSYWGNDNQNHTVQNSSFNFGNHFRHILNDIQINSGGQLYVNKEIGTNYGLTNDYYNTTDRHFKTESFELRTANCGSEVEINNGGTFSIGDNNTPVNNKGTVYIREGSNLYLHSGSSLYLYWGSKLIIEKGATLFVDPGANIYLEDNATIEIKGQLNLSNNAVFKHNGSGKVIFNNTDGNFTIGAASGSSIEFTSTKNETKLEVSGAITFPNTLGMFKVDGAIVVANTGAKFDIYSPVYFDNGIFKPSSNNTNNNWVGLKFYNQIDNQIHIDQSKFYYANTALDFSVDYALNTPSFYRNEFYNNNLAMYIHDAGFTLNNCIFKENVKGIKANWITLSSTIQGCRFKDNTLGIDYHGNINALLLLKNNNIIASDIDIVASSSYPFIVTMGCNKFTNTNIDIDYANLNLSSTTLHNTSDYGGYNIFKESPFGLYNINYLNLKDGYNDFIMTGNVYINGSISNSNNMSSSQCNYNYFDRINGGAYALPNGITYNYYYGKLNISYLNANTQVSSNFKLYGTLATQQNGGCQSTGGGLAPSIAENFKTETLTTSKLYPNPTDELLNIEMPYSEGTTKITVIDMQGKTVFNEQLAAGTQLHTLPVKELPAGVYMMMLEREGTVEKLRFVRQ